MKPKDENGKLPTDRRPFRVLIIAGSGRRQYNGPGVDSKSRTLMLRAAERLPQDWEIDMEDKDETLSPKKSEGDRLRKK